MSDWQPIEAAPKDRTIIWACLRPDLEEAGMMRGWAGRQIPLQHGGFTVSGFDMGWSVAAPVGFGGLPDAWIAGWMPLPEAPSTPDTLGETKQ